MIFMPDFMVRFWVGQVKKIQKMRDAVALFHRRVQSAKNRIGIENLSKKNMFSYKVLHVIVHRICCSNK